MPINRQECQRLATIKMQKKSKWKYKEGKGIWKNYVNEDTGEQTIKRYTPRKITKFDECEEHFFGRVDSYGNTQCKHCGFGQKIVWGKQLIEEGKIVEVIK